MRSAVIALLLTTVAAHAQSSNPVTVTPRAAAAPCWIHLTKSTIVNAAKVIGFRKVENSGIVLVDIDGAEYLPTVDTGSVGHQDQYINQQRLAIAACFGDTTEGLGPTASNY